VAESRTLESRDAVVPARDGTMSEADKRPMIDVDRLGWSRNIRYFYDLASVLVARDFRIRYRRSIFGTSWALLLPIAQAATLVFVFQTVLRLDIDAYGAFVFAALLPWTWFNTGLVSATGQFVENRDLVRHPGFSPPVLVVVTTVSNFMMYLAALPILLVLLVWYGRVPGPAILLYFPVIVAFQALLIIGLGIVCATLNVFYRDIYYLMTVGLMLLFYLTPIFYQPPVGVPLYDVVYAANPMAAIVEATRDIFFHGTAPKMRDLVLAGTSSVLCFFFGLWLWSKMGAEMFDEL
jgi:lipopolysaccharide transport system permease protein